MISSVVIQIAFLFNAANGILRLILIGSIVYLGCGVLSFTSNLQGKSFFGIPDIGWIFIGIFLDILFFSAAMGARLKGIANEQRESLFKNTTAGNREIECGVCHAGKRAPPH